MSALNDESNDGSKNNFGDTYLHSLALKYPMVGGKVKGMKTLDKSTLMKRLGSMITNGESGTNAGK